MDIHATFPHYGLKNIMEIAFAIDMPFSIKYQQ